MNVATGTRTSRARERLPRARDCLPAALAITAFLLVTNYWTGLASHTHPWGNDVLSYQAMAEAAPGLPKIVLGSAYTQRFAPHYLIGLLHWASGVGIHATYRIVWALCFACLLALLARILLAMRLRPFLFAVSFALFALNPYSLREGILTPGAVQDLTFVLGLCLLMWGLLERRFAAVLVGTVVAVLSRQTELLVAPVAAYWVLSGPGWRERAPRLRRVRAAAVVLLTVLPYVAMDLVTASFTKRFEPSFPKDTILPLLVPSHAHLSVLASHLGRCAIPLVIPTAAILATLVATRLRLGRLPRLPFEFYASLAMAAAVIVQPVGISPSFPGFAHNEQRLVGIGLLPLALAGALALRQAQEHDALRLSRSLACVVLGALLLGSLHQIYTVIGPPNLGFFIVFQILAAALVCAALLAPAVLSNRASTRAGAHP